MHQLEPDQRYIGIGLPVCMPQLHCQDQIKCVKVMGPSAGTLLPPLFPYSFQRTIYVAIKFLSTTLDILYNLSWIAATLCCHIIL